MAMANIDLSHRITIIGGTGDGKTTLALKLISMIGKKYKVPAVFLNPGAEPKLYERLGEPRMDIDDTWPEFQHITPPVTPDFKKYGRIFAQIVQHGRNLTYIDETALMAGANIYSHWLLYLYQMGRRRKCMTVAVSQRPVAIPPFVYNQADHIFVGDVLGNDLKRLEELTSQPWRQAIQNREPYQFLYWSRHVKEPPKVVYLP